MPNTATTKIDSNTGELRREYGERLFIGPLPEPWYREIDDPRYPRRPMVCSYCGVRPTTKIASGTPECQRCWNWRKLDAPAAYHWLKVSTVFASNVDAYDYTKFFPETLKIPAQTFGMTIETATKIQNECFRLVEEHHSTEYAVSLCNKALEPYNMKLVRHPVTHEPLPEEV